MIKELFLLFGVVVILYVVAIIFVTIIAWGCELIDLPYISKKERNDNE